ncbi:MAG TPA: hypothetical protein VMT97_01425 [Terriglobales bacterium]|nr:hypothetical protein [Terriglobales bacterium]
MTARLRFAVPSLALLGILTAASSVEPFGSLDAQTRLLIQELLLSVWSA